MLDAALQLQQLPACEPPVRAQVVIMVMVVVVVVVVVTGSSQGTSLSHVHCHGFLHQNMLVCGQEFHPHVRMTRMCGADDHAVHFGQRLGVSQ